MNFYFLCYLSKKKKLHEVLLKNKKAKRTNER